jgi:serine/threonine protein kinase
VTTSLTGQTLGKTTIQELLGQGGMATVYKGYQAEIDRFVAVKVMTPLHGQDIAFFDRFKLETRVIARLQHPHILPLYDFGEEQGLLYLITAYAPGGSLSDLIARGALLPTQVERLLGEVASALDYAHRQGVIHRDIKPANILLDREGHALLADFGIVKILSGGTTTPAITTTTGIIGTPAYMSPEQANGAVLDGRSDVYALGVVAYEMLTGQQPFSAETPLQVLIKHLTEPPPLLRQSAANLPASLEIVLQRSLAKDPADRYATATDFANAFKGALSASGTNTLRLPDPPPTNVASSQPVLPPTGSTTYVSPPAPRGGQTMLITAGLALAALALALLAIITVNQRGAPAVATLPPATNAPTSAPTNAPAQVAARNDLGSVRYSTTNALGDTLTLTAENLAPLPPGSRYFAWLLNTADDAVQNLGELAVDVQGSGTLFYTDEEGRLLPAIYNQVSLSVESEDTDTPKGEIVYIASVPAALTDALRAILLESPDGINGGSLLDGAIREATIGRQHAGYGSNASNLNGVRLHAEHTINILLGTQEDLDGNGRGENPGRGIGMAFFLDAILAQIDAASENPTVQTQVESIRVCAANARGWMDEVIALERELLTIDDIDAPGVTESRQRSTDAASEMIDGIDLNGNGSVELFEGECALRQISESGILAGNLTLRAVEGE